MSNSVLTNDAVDAGAHVIARHASFGLKWDELSEPVQEFWRSASRASLAAIVPLLDREAIQDAIRDELLPSLGLEIAAPLAKDATDAVLALLGGES